MALWARDFCNSTLGGSVTPTSGAPSRPIPDLDPADYCGEADYIFVGQFATEVATMTTRNISTGTWWGWKWSGGTYTTDSDDDVPPPAVPLAMLDLKPLAVPGAEAF